MNGVGLLTKYFDAKFARSRSQIIVERRERRLSAHGKVEVSSVVHCQPMSSCQWKNVRKDAISTDVVDFWTDNAKLVEELARLRGRDAQPPLGHR